MENYQKIKAIGRGAHGSVALFVRRSDAKRVVIKEIPAELKSMKEREDALLEAQTLQMFNFPFIIGYYEYFFDQDNLCIVMEYADGGTLADYLLDRCGHLLDEKQVLHLFAQLLVSLHHLHSRQVLHRDLKTQNILMNRSQTICKVSDFGISKVLANTKSKATTVLGTPSYMSPELCEGQPYNQKSDIWALGCILFELVTLRRAFDAETMGALVVKIMRGEFAPIPQTVSSKVRGLIEQMLDRDPRKRPTVASLMSRPCMIGPIVKLMTEMGSIPITRTRPLKRNLNPKLRSSLGSRANHAINNPNPHAEVQKKYSK